MTKVLAVAALLFPLAAQAADVQVSYLVDLKMLKASAPAGTALTFTLYSDNACTTQVSQQTVNVENVNVIESLKRVTPKGAPKTPGTAQLVTTLAGVNPPVSSYLKVTGTGVTPVGGGCQLQFASMTSQAVPGLVLVDSMSKVVGPLDRNPPVGNPEVVIPFGGGAVGLAISNNPGPWSLGFGHDIFYFLYTSTDCTGPRLLNVDASPVRDQAFQQGTIAYFGPSTGTGQIINSLSFAVSNAASCTGSLGQTWTPPDNCCCPQGSCFSPQPHVAGPPDTLDMSTTGFTPPFHPAVQ